MTATIGFTNEKTEHHSEQGKPEGWRPACSDQRSKTTSAVGPWPVRVGIEETPQLAEDLLNQLDCLSFADKQ